MGEAVSVNPANELVSIALPSFNAEKTIGDAIASILLQTWENWELLLIDDGSKDRTVEIAQSFDDPRIRIISDGQNKGLPTRLNEAIDLASGKYFARMDNDDICFPDRLKKQVEHLESHPEIDLLGTKALAFVSPGKATGFFPFRQTHEEICARPWNGFYLPHPTWMGRIEWFRKYRYRIVDRAEDQDLLLRSYSESRFECLPEVLFAYRLRDQVSLRINRIARKSFLKSQLSLFSGRSQWRYWMLSVVAYAAKSSGDSWNALIGGNPKQIHADLSWILPQWEAFKSKLAQFQTGNRK
jgi:glycosyltransferase involved in cell wall biosynthesis